MKTDKIGKLIAKNQERNNLHWRVVNNKKMFNVNGLWYDEQFLDQMFPKYEYCKYMSKGENPDKSHI